MNKQKPFIHDRSSALLLSLLFFKLFIPLVQAQTLEGLLRDYFTLEDSNTEFAKAQVIILGDPDHRDSDGARNRMKLVNLAIQRENADLSAPRRVSIHLLEQLDSKTSIPPHLLAKHRDYAGYLPEVIVSGWNSDRWNEVAISELKKSKKIEEKLRDLQERQGNLRSVLMKTKNRDKVVKNIQALQDEQDACEVEAKETMKAFYRATIGERNKHMIEVIGGLLAEGRPEVRLFISAGSGHLDHKRVQRFAGQEGDILAFLKRAKIPFVYYKTVPYASGDTSASQKKYGLEQIENRDHDFNPWDVVENALPQLVEQTHQHLTLMRELKQKFRQQSLLKSLHKDSHAEN